MKKKLITVLASLTALSLLATACSGGGAGNKTSLLQKGLELAGQLDLLAESEDYRKSVTTAQEVTGVVEEIEPEKNRVSVMVSMFGRETPVELELDQVEVQD